MERSTFERQKERVIKNETNKKKSIIRINTGREKSPHQRELVVKSFID